MIETARFFLLCDMICTVSLERLTKPYKKTRAGRQYVTHMLNDDDLAAVKACIKAYFGF